MAGLSSDWEPAEPALANPGTFDHRFPFPCGIDREVDE
jgi:hypothetical protein